jgi:hypothetical protein
MSGMEQGEGDESKVAANRKIEKGGTICTEICSIFTIELYI